MLQDGIFFVNHENPVVIYFSFLDLKFFCSIRCVDTFPLQPSQSLQSLHCPSETSGGTQCGCFRRQSNEETVVFVLCGLVLTRFGDGVLCRCSRIFGVAVFAD
jgi:hypothetical protein